MVDFENMHRTAESRQSGASEAQNPEPQEAEIVFDEVVLEVDRNTVHDQKNARLLGHLLVAFVVLVPIPLGSNRPVYWMFEAAVIGALAMWYYGDLLLRRSERESRLSDVKIPLVAGAVILVFALLQLIPFGWSFDPIFAALPEQMRPKSISVDRGATMLAIIRIASYITFFALCIETARNARRVNRLAWIAYWGIFAHAVWGLVSLIVLNDFALWGEKTAYEGVATGTFVNRNSFATFLGMGGCLGVALVLNHGRRPATRPLGGGRRLFSEKNVEMAVLWLSVVLIFVTLLSTQSRMGFLASAVGVVVVVALGAFKVGLSGGRTAMIFGLFGVAAFVLFGAGTVERFLFSGKNADTRFDLYSQVFDQILQRPFVGFGLDSFPSFYEVVHRPPVSSFYVWDLAHSTYLGLWVELGVIVGSLPMVALAWCFWRAVGHVRRRQSAFAIPTAAVGIMIMVALHSTVDFSLEISANVFFLIFIAALGVARLTRQA